MDAADDQLRTIISLYEEEKIQLQKQIEESLADSEYLMAHYHSEALNQLSRRLNALNNFDDKFYDDKERGARKIRFLQRQIEGESSGVWVKDYEEELAKAEIERLNQISKDETLQFGETFLDQTFDKLLSGKIKKFNLVLNKKDNFFLSFQYSKKVLKVTVPYAEHDGKSWWLGDENMIHIKKLGFELINSETKLALQLAGNKDAILQKLKLILAKIIFEVFYYKEFENETYIEFKEKPKR